MMRSTFFGLEIGRSGLSTAQYGLDVTGHNIANLDTEGYTRQRIVSTAYDPYATIGKFAPASQALVGEGVRVQILDQIRSAYLDRRFRTESNELAYWETRSQSLSYIESFFDNVNEKTSINFSMAEFFRAMTIISEDPVAGAPRTLMQTAAMDLVQQLHMMYDGLVDLQRVENRAVVTKIDDINRMAADLVELNKVIYVHEITGLIANDLRDKRNLLLDELSKLVDIEYEEYPDELGQSMMRVKVTGETLVDHDYKNVLVVGEIPNPLEGGDPILVPYWEYRMDLLIPRPPEGSTQAVIDAYRAAVQDTLAADWAEERRSIALDMARLNGGELKAHIDMRDGTGEGIDSRSNGIPYYIEMLNNLARALVVEINTVHVAGWSDNPEGSRTGILFFTDMGVGTVIYRDADGNDLPEPVDPDDPAIASAVYYIDMNDPDSLEALRGITARNIFLSQDIIDSAYNIAASAAPIGRAGDATPIELQRANNENIKLMYDLFRKTGITMLGEDIGSFDDYGTKLRFDVGKTLYTANQAKETSRILTLSALNQKTAIAGVSLDEEMVGLVRYNHAYNGAARVITAMDDALDRLINGTGRVGL